MKRQSLFLLFLLLSMFWYGCEISTGDQAPVEPEFPVESAVVLGGTVTTQGSTVVLTDDTFDPNNEVSERGIRWTGELGSLRVFLELAEVGSQHLVAITSVGEYLVTQEALDRDGRVLRVTEYRLVVTSLVAPPAIAEEVR